MHEGPVEYWFEVFRKAVVVPSDEEFLIDYDVYAEKNCEDLGAVITNSLSIQGRNIKLYYCELPVERVFSGLKTCNLASIVKQVMLVMLEYRADNNSLKHEIIDVQVRTKRISGEKLEVILKTMYDLIVHYIEGRNPSSKPLSKLIGNRS